MASESVREEITVDGLAAKVGEEIGVSPWLDVSQGMIDAFAELTGDRQFIHIDPERAAAETPFGGAIAHGFLTLSLLSQMAHAALPTLGGTVMGINYGFDRIRFLTPVPSGGRIRGRFRLAELADFAPGMIGCRYQVTVEIDGADKPALAADWLTRFTLEMS